VPLFDATKHLINSQRIAQMRKWAVLLNFARGGIVNEEDVKQALTNKHLATFVTDFPSPTLQGIDNVIALPHLGASTLEAESHCAIMAVEQLRDFLEHGQIRNAVNFPDIHLPWNGTARLCITNANVPNMVGQISRLLSNAGLNLVEMLNKSHDNVAYTLIDIDKKVPEDVYEHIRSLEGVLMTRVIE